jgi:hypothetical protein
MNVEGEQIITPNRLAYLRNQYASAAPPNSPVLAQHTLVVLLEYQGKWIRKRTGHPDPRDALARSVDRTLFFVPWFRIEEYQTDIANIRMIKASAGAPRRDRKDDSGPRPRKDAKVKEPVDPNFTIGVGHIDESKIKEIDPSEVANRRTATMHAIVGVTNTRIGLTMNIPALLDTGADLSCMSALFARALQLKLLPVASVPEVANLSLTGVDNQQCDCAGVAIVMLKTTHKEMAVRLMVLKDMEESMILGRDLMGELGITLSGLPSGYPAQTERDEYDPLFDHSDEIRQFDQRCKETDAGLDGKLLDQFMERVNGAIRRNEALPMSSKCDLPIAIVRLPLKPGEEPVFQHQYGMSGQKKEALKAQIKEWMACGFVVRGSSNSPYNIPIFAVLKREAPGEKKTSWRFVMDLRKLNPKLDVKMRENIPHIEDMWPLLDGFVLVTALDLTNAYFHCPLFGPDQDKLTFSLDGERFKWVVAPFGLLHLVSHFQDLMETMVEDLRTRILLIIYLDDIIIPTRRLTPDEPIEVTMVRHAQHVAEVIDRLTKHGMRLKAKKCRFAKFVMRILGHICTGAGTRPDPEKLEVLRDYPRPRTTTQVFAFLGFVNFLRKYIVDYATLYGPIEALRNVRDVVAAWTADPRCEAAFTSTLAILENAPLIQQPQPGLLLKIATDASDFGMAAVLFQGEHKDPSLMRICGLAAKAFNKQQQKYATPMKELLAVIMALQKFHELLHGVEFVLYTDHKSLTYLLTQTQPSKMLVRCLDIIQQFRFTIVHCPGIDNILPDRLSRIYPTHSLLGGGELQRNSALRSTVSLPFLKHLEQLRISLTPEEEKQRLVLVQNEKTLKSSSRKRKSHEAVTDRSEVCALSASGPTLEDEIGTVILPISDAKTGAVIRRIRLEYKGTPDQLAAIFYEKKVPPTEQRAAIVERAHADAGHFGAEVVHERLWAEGYFWQGMMRDCQVCQFACDECLRHAVKRVGYRPLKSIEAKYPFDHVAADLCTFSKQKSHRGNLYCMVWVDVATKFTVLVALKTKGAKEVAEAMFNVISLFGIPKIIQTDGGGEFKAATLEMAKLMGVDSRLTSPYHPSANGAAERTVGLVKTTMNKMCQGNLANWDLHLPVVQMALNNRIHSETGSTPMELMYARPTNSFMDYKDVKSNLKTPAELVQDGIRTLTILHPAIAERVAERRTKRNEYFDKAHRRMRHVEMERGDWCMILDPVKRNAGEPNWIGPYKVLGKTHGSYQLTDLNNKVLGRTVAPEHTKKIPVPRAKDADSKEVAIGSIVTHKGTTGNFQYYVHWKGFPNSEDSWVHNDEFVDTNIIREYWKRQGPRTGNAPVASAVGVGTTPARKQTAARSDSKLTTAVAEAEQEYVPLKIWNKVVIKDKWTGKPELFYEVEWIVNEFDGVDSKSYQRCETFDLYTDYDDLIQDFVDEVGPDRITDVAKEFAKAQEEYLRTNVDSKSSKRRKTSVSTAVDLGSSAKASVPVLDDAVIRADVEASPASSASLRGVPAEASSSNLRRSTRGKDNPRGL